MLAVIEFAIGCVHIDKLKRTIDGDLKPCGREEEEEDVFLFYDGFRSVAVYGSHTIQLDTRTGLVDCALI